MPDHNDQPEFWEASFSEKREMWGLAPARCAVLAKDLFVQHGIRQVLIPGIGYGRNAQVFREAGLHVTGIEISQTAIDLARRHYGPDLPIHHGSVTNMPFDSAQYEGIFCHALIHLLDEHQRHELLRACYRQLAPGGYMVFTAITKQAPTYGQGTYLGPDRYERIAGAKLFFYDPESVRSEFGPFGLTDVVEVQESHPLYLITCQKAPNGPG